jgi:tRNA-specific 2-thiouridylase
VDEGKDQSYVLYTLGQAELARLLLPVGEHEKAEVRRIAARFGLPVADKPDSNEICFVPGNDYRAFLGEYAGIRPGAGALVDVTTNAVVGEHDGYTGFTVGQRKGLGAFGAPRYVTGIRPESNIVLIGELDALLASTAYARKLSWVSGAPPSGDLRIDAKIRYKSRPAPATLRVEDGVAEVRFDEPQRAITPGQAIVFYDGEAVVGGGTIEESAH